VGDGVGVLIFMVVGERVDVGMIGVVSCLMGGFGGRSASGWQATRRRVMERRNRKDKYFINWNTLIYYF
jgi:hypothetical protein